MLSFFIYKLKPGIKKTDFIYEFYKLIKHEFILINEYFICFL